MNDDFVGAVFFRELEHNQRGVATLNNWTLIKKLGCSIKDTPVKLNTATINQVGESSCWIKLV